MKLGIKNFRSIREAEIDLAPMTILYGANGSGKSSLIYALQTLRNIVVNPARQMADFFTYGPISLGDFGSVVENHKVRGAISLSMIAEDRDANVEYRVKLTDGFGELILDLLQLSGAPIVPFSIATSFPYRLNRQVTAIAEGHREFSQINWNGVAASVSPTAAGHENLAWEFAQKLNNPVNFIGRSTLVPVQRGFLKPQFESVSVSSGAYTEDEVASILYQNKHLVVKVSKYLEQIVGRELRVNPKPGTQLYTLDCIDRNTGTLSEIINEGFGVNQIVFMLTKALQPDVETICIEEPEMNLHPTAIRSVARALADISYLEGRRFIITTHSEAFVLALLSLVTEGRLDPNRLGMYFVKKEHGETQFERQAVNSQGQIEGGLSSFMEGELQDIKSFLGLN